MRDSKSEIANCVSMLEQGKIILYPTDTIWGIGCDATNESAVRRIFEIKKRSDSKSLVSLVSDLEMLARHTTVTDFALETVNSTIHPTTVIYSEVSGLSSLAVAPDGSAAIRVSTDDFCKNLIGSFGKPIISTSANISGEPSPKSYEDISDEIKTLVDHISNPEMDSSQGNKASKIIRIVNDEIIIIRE